MNTPKRIGLIGPGLMGHGISKNIIEKGYPLAVLGHRNRTPVEDLLQRGATEVSSAKELAQQTDMVILCLTGSTQVEEIVYSENGLLAGMHDGLIIADATTAEPQSTVKVAAKIHSAGGYYVDIPMTRSAKEAEAGTLGLMTGGDPKVLETIRPILDCFADTIVYAGDVGAAHKLKLINNFLSLGHAALAAEAICAAAKADVDLQALHDIVLSGGANSVMFSRVMNVALNDDDTQQQFSIDNARKDLRYYTNMTEMTPSSSFIAETIHQSYILAVNHGYGDRFIPRMLDLMGQLNGVEVRKK